MYTSLVIFSYFRSLSVRKSACVKVVLVPKIIRLDSQSKVQAPVVQRLDNAIHRINHYPADSVVCFVDTYPLDSDLSGG